MVKPGYKETEIGCIPDSWSVTSIGNIASFSGGSQPPIQYFSAQRQDGYIRLIQIRDYKTDKYATYIPTSMARRFCSKNDIMIGRYGPPIFQILRGIEGAYNVALIKVTPIDVDQDYLFYTLKRNDLFEYIELLSRRSSGQTGVDLEGLRNYQIALPPLNEQKKIAKVLSNMDASIASLEKLITKKKKIKQGTMQDLFSGGIIVPGTSGKWKELRIRDAGYLTKASVNPQDHPDEIYTEYSMPSYDNGRSPVITKGSTMYSNRTIIDGEVLLFNKLNVRQRRIWYVPECGSNAVCSAEFLAYKSEKLDLQLLSQILNTDKVTDEFINMSTGTSNSQRRITPSDFLDYIVKFPENRNEQKAITSVLFDMDKEIESLEKKLAKCRQAKQGMMQQLLTGKIRLV